jgi:adenylate cyclase
MFLEKGLWLATATPLLGIGIAFVGTGSGAYLVERRRAHDIRSAFSRYVSSDVVAEIVAHPELLRLGGRRREITILFCDLAGFTSLSEALTPEQVSHLINVYLNAMTKIIMANSGTIDKYIGDAIMAFWGAPLDDDEHALHAVQSAIKMQETMRDLQPEFQEMGVKSLALRIGINTGPAVIGNMGSDLRFDYTAIGDSVNLSSRLEGVNKAYGTDIMLSETTAAPLNGRILLRPVDRVRVKGKKVPVDVFTPCEDPVVVDLTQRAWSAYLARDWAGARGCWKEIRERLPNDPLAEIFEGRIDSLGSSPPPEDWDGSVALEKL